MVADIDFVKLYHVTVLQDAWPGYAFSIYQRAICAAQI